MAVADVIRLLFLPFVLIFLAFYGYRLYQKSNRISRSALIRLSASMALIPFHPLVRAIDDVPFIVEVLSIPTQYFALAFSYLGFKQLKNDKVYIPILRDPVFRITAIFSLVSITFAILSHDNLPSFSDNEPFRPTVFYYAHYLTNYGLAFFITACIVISHLIYKGKYRDLADKLRVNVAITGIAFFCLGLAAMTLNVILSALNPAMNRVPLNNIYHLGKALLALLLLCAAVLVLLPRKYILMVLTPYENYRRHQQNEQQLLIDYLYQKMTSIIPAIKLQQVNLKFEDKLIEIADAWLLIWSTQRTTEKRIARQDAEVLYQLLRQNTVITGPGEFDPPPAHKDEVDYNVAVARRLRELEGVAG